MKKLIFALVFLTILITVSCGRNDYRYKIKGTVITDNGPHPAIWYTDTISFNDDTAYYVNSDGSKVTIRPPYTLIDNIKHQNIKK